MKIVSIHTYLADLDKKIKKVRSSSSVAGTPNIGIFWVILKNGTFSIFDGSMYPIEFGMNYGQFIIAKEDHYQTWELFKRKSIIPEHLEYDDLPRGRILFDTELKKYKVLTGKWIIPAIKSSIINAYHLPIDSIWDTDFHYNRYKQWSLT
jgi:hypothetical protein